MIVNSSRKGSRKHQAAVALHAILSYCVKQQRPRFWALTAVIAIMFAVECFPAQQWPADDTQYGHEHAAKIAAKAPKQRSKIVAASNGGVTITFSECRENEKQHVSCKFEDSEGNEHWVYLAGVPLPK